MNTETFSVCAIGRVVSTRERARDDNWDAETSRIDLDPDVMAADATKGLDAFSHVEVVYVFDRVGKDALVNGARHPRDNRDWPAVGILAQRGRNRPNRLGVTVCELIAVDDGQIHLRGLDAIDGTPVLDVKPVIRGFLPRGEVTEPRWAAEIMAAYW